MTDRLSVYHEELFRRGFVEAEIVEEVHDESPANTEKLDAFRSLRNSKIPHFMFSRAEIIGAPSTFAFDERGEVWICDGEMDLTSIGFVFFDYKRGQIKNERRLN